MERRQGSPFFLVLVVFGLTALAFWVWQSRASTLSEAEATPISETAPTGYPGPVDPTPTVIVPTATPTQTPTPTVPECTFKTSVDFESTSPSSLENYVFGEPKIVLAGKTALLTVEWLPGSKQLLYTRELRDRVAESVEILDLTSGGTRVYGEKSGDSTSFNSRPIWLPSENAVAFVTLSLEGQASLRLSRGVIDAAEDLPIELGNSHIALNSVDQQLTAITAAPSAALVTFNVAENRATSALDLSILNEQPDQIATITSLSWSPNGRTIAFSGRRGLFLGNTGDRSLCVVKLNSDGEAERWAVTANWSPSGRYLVLLDTLGDPVLPYIHLALLDTNTGEIRDIDLGLHSIYTANWSPTKDVLLVVGARDPESLESEGKRNQQEMYLIEILGEKSKRLLEDQPLFFTGIWGAAWSPDGEAIAYSCPEVDEIGNVIEGRICVATLTIK